MPLRSTPFRSRALVAPALAALALACSDPGDPVPVRPTLPIQPRLAASLDPGSPYGIIVHTFQPNGVNQGAAEVTDLLNAATGTGARWARVTFYWNAFEDVEDEPFDPSTNRYVFALDSLEQRGFSIYGTIEHPPGWATYDGTIRGEVKADRLWKWKRFVQRLEAAYGSRVRYWAILNEMNCRSWYLGTTAGYDSLVATAAAGLPAGKVALGEATLMNDQSIVAGQPNCTPGATWIQQRLANYAQVGRHVSIVPVHDYVDPGQGREIVAKVRTVVGVAQGKPVWLTEFGLNAAESFTDAARRDSAAAGIVRDVYRAVRDGEVPGWQKAFYYRLWTPDAHQAYGLLDPTAVGGTFRRRVSWHAYHAITANLTDPVLARQPVAHWWRHGDGMWSTDSTAAGNPGYGLVRVNDWAVVRDGSAPGTGWHPLFRCTYADPASNGAHYVSQFWACNEPGEVAGTRDLVYGFASDYPRPGLVPLYRFKHVAMSDYVATADAAQAATMRTQPGWTELPLLGYVWPGGGPLY